MIYLSLPYTHQEWSVRSWRYHRARQALFLLWEQGTPAICPVVLGHEFEARRGKGKPPMPHEFYMRMSLNILPTCTHLLVLTLPGWRDSKGVEAEVTLAARLGRPVQGWACFDSCEEVSGLAILQEFGAHEYLKASAPIPILKTTGGEE